MDIISEVVRKLVEIFTAFSKNDSQVITKMEEFLTSLKESISKLDSSPTSSVSHEPLSKMFSSLESNFKAESAPLLKLVKLIPTDAPPVQIRVQGGKGVGFGSSKETSDGKVVGKVMSTQTPTSLLTSMTTT